MDNSNTVDKLLLQVLSKLNTSSQEIQSSAVMSRDGLHVASILGEGVDQDRLGAMCASMLSLADKTAKELGRGELKQLLVNGEEGYLLLIKVGNEAVLTVVSRPHANLGKVLLEAKKTAAMIAKVLHVDML